MRPLFFIIFILACFSVSYAQKNIQQPIVKVKTDTSYIISDWYPVNKVEKQKIMDSLLQKLSVFLKNNDTLCLYIEGWTDCRTDLSDRDKYYFLDEGHFTSSLVRHIISQLKELKVKNLIIAEGKGCKEGVHNQYDASNIACLTIKKEPTYTFEMGTDFPCRDIRFWSGWPCGYCDTADLTVNSYNQLRICDYYLKKEPTLKLCLYINPLLTRNTFLLERRVKTVKNRMKQLLEYHNRFEVKVFEGAPPKEHKYHEAWVVVTKF